ncbi:unnamed protein product [Cunninghamella echinulata]
MELDEALMEQLLAKLNWKSGIRPLGDIATESCFVQKQMPFIKQQLVETQSSSILVTQSSWTNQLIHSGVISDINDHTTMHSLSELHLLFHTRQQQPAHRTFHRLQFDAHAYFLVNQILRPTIKFQRVLESALNHLPDDPDRAWQELCKVWHDFGFLWPQKIILGSCKHHIKHVYQVQNDGERLPQLQSANEITSNAMNIELQKYGRSKGKELSSFTNQHNNTSIMSEDHHQKLRQSVLSWEIIKRTDVRPIYEFLPTEMRDVIYQLIKQFVHRIPFNTPFLLRNISTGGYLCWRRNIRQQVQQLQQQQQVHENTASKQENHQHKPYLFATLPITDVNLQSFTWKFTNTIPDNTQNNSHQPILPSSPPSSLSHQILTSNLSDGIKSLHWNPILEKTTRVRSLEFTNLSTSTDIPLQQQQQHCWTIESPDLGLDHDDDISTDGHLNVDIAIGRLKPILHKEIISLRQILYLCSVNNQVSRSSTLTQGIHQSNAATHSNHRHRHKNIDECESPQFLGIPSPVPPAAAAVMAIVQHDLLEESSLDPYVNNNNNNNNNNNDNSNTYHISMNQQQQQQQQRFDESNIISSNSTLPLTSTTANTSQTSLPFYNLQTYTVLSNPSKVFSPMISPSHSTSPLLSTQQKQKQQQQHSLNPVLAKEHALISELEESYWMIELYSQFEKDQHEQQQQQQQQQHKGKQKLQSNHHHEYNTKRPQLKMVMSLDTLREDAQNNKQMDYTFNNGEDNESLRRVQSFSSVYDHQFNQKQQEEQKNNNSSTFQRFSGMLIEKNETKKHSYNHSNHNSNNINSNNNNNNNIIQSQQQDLNTSTSTNTYIYKDQFMLTGGIAQERAHHKVQPYLRLYAAKQNNKTWSHFFKQSSLTNVKRWLKSE